MSVITFIASGTRGDVQPTLALGKALQQPGHTVRILAGANFADWIQQQGLIPLPTQIDMQALMASEGGRDWVEKGHNPVLQLRIMKRLLDRHGMQIASDAWDACQGSDLIVSSFTSDVYAVGMAEKLGIAHMSAPLQPTLFTTKDGRVLLNAPLPNRISWINYFFGKLFIETAAWNLYGDIANRTRTELLGLPAQTQAENRADRQKMTIIHGYSPHVVPHPEDWPSNFHTAGYWFLDENEQWQPPGNLLDFLGAGSPPVAIGFGSMTGRNPQKMNEIVLEAVQMSGQRAIFLSGWAGLGEIQLPESVLQLPAVPHGWLFPKMAAVVHHGGAGTTAAGLRAGIPSILVPHFADQPFWGQRVASLGVGPKAIMRHKLTAHKLADAIDTAVSNQSMRQNAAALGEKIRAEDGIGRAVALIEKRLEIGD
jgi:UDP:flavonoid glycosyltransferase YjiC (YdhE family)